MIKKLKRRLIFIMMALLTIVLVTAFTAQIWSSASKMKTESISDLAGDYSRLNINKGDDEFNRLPDQPVGDFTQPFDGYSHFSTFFVTINDNGEITKIDDFSRNLTYDIAYEAAEAALQDGGVQGTIASMNLRYAVFEGENKIIGFADISYERSFIRQQIINYSFIGLGSLAAFFIISLILSNIAVHPVDKAWKKQHQFIADASHELKTPITVMLANTSILLSEKKPDKKQVDKWVSNIDYEAKHMQKLVEELLFLARVDGNDQVKMQSKIDLSDIVFQGVLPFEATMFEAGKELKTEIGSDISIIGNAGQIKQLINIFLDNARKYALTDSEINLKLYKENGKAILEVNNQAEPISKEDMPRIFDRFYKVDKARTRDASANSYGLGLAIAHEIVTMHKGKISVKSNKENGTTFTVSFPI